MKTDTYTKMVLTVIALLLAALVVRPSMQPVHAAATTKYAYSWGASAGLGPADMEDAMRALKAATDSGYEVIAALPIAGQRNDNIAMGTTHILYICRKPQ